MTSHVPAPELVLGNGWLVARYPRIQCAYFGDGVDACGFDAYAEQLAHEIDRRRTSQRIGVFYYAPAAAAMDSPRRRRIAKILNDRKDKLQRTTAAYAMATHSPFVRGVLTTLFWMAPPGYPNKLVATPEQGLGFLAEHMHGVDAKGIAAAFQRLLDEQVSTDYRCVGS